MGIVIDENEQRARRIEAVHEDPPKGDVLNEERLARRRARAAREKKPTKSELARRREG